MTSLCNIIWITKIWSNDWKKSIYIYSYFTSLTTKRHSILYHQRLWCTLKDMGVPEHLIVVLRNLSTNQESAVRKEYGETSKIGKGVLQGCILSPLLFDIYVERIMRDVLEKWDIPLYKGISIGGRNVTNPRYSDDTTLIVGTKDDLKELII